MRRGMTLMEIVIVTALALILFGSGMQLFIGSSRHVQEGTELLDAQAQLDRIERYLRHDIRALRRLRSWTPETLEFVVIRDGGEQVVRYSFDVSRKALVRETTDIAGRKEHPLGDPGWVEACRFAVVMDGDAFDRADLLLQINTDRLGKAGASRLTVASQFTSRCRESYRPWRQGGN
ncbi:type II secretion system protein [Candidatus Ozemobacteraceae bacterium]|nr:type II secretion system protein [Candidatus Ozemobacteraceae bacterium]